MTQEAERRVMAMMTAGKGQTRPVLTSERAPAQVQGTARELGLRRLTPAQARAATLILSSSDCTVLVQGRAGRCWGLAVAGTIAAQLKRDLAAPARTIASFIGQHQKILDGSASPKQWGEARAALGGALLLADEASQIGTAQMSELLLIAERLKVGRVALIGDKRQTGAVEAGKPFAQDQG